MSAALLTVEALSVHHGHIPAVQGISLEVGTGECWAIVGANGSGKSSMLRAVAGVERGRVEGRISFGGLGGDPGRGISTASAVAARRAFVPQRPEVHADFTAREIVRLGRYALGPDDAAVERAIADVGLAQRAHLPFHALSGGERQRIAIARALAQVGEGGVLLLDEPFASIDPAEVARLARVLGARAAHGAVVVSLHDPGLARAIATHAIVLRCGMVVAQGPVATTLSAALLGEAYGHALVELSSNGVEWIVPDLTSGAIGGMRASTAAESERPDPNAGRMSP